jgi:hypothetical protein
VFLLDQAPSISEIRNGKAFQGQAGDSIRQIFATAGVRPSRFDSVIYQAYLSQSVFQAVKGFYEKTRGLLRCFSMRKIEFPTRRRLRIVARSCRDRSNTSGPSNHSFGQVGYRGIARIDEAKIFG